MDYLDKDYGFWGLVLYIAVKEIWPYFRDKFFPEKQKFEQTQEARVTAAIEGIREAMTGMAVAITTQNERISQVITMQLQHDRDTKVRKRGTK